MLRADVVSCPRKKKKIYNDLRVVRRREKLIFTVENYISKTYYSPWWVSKTRDEKSALKSVGLVSSTANARVHGSRNAYAGEHFSRVQKHRVSLFTTEINSRQLF